MLMRSWLKHLTYTTVAAIYWGGFQRQAQMSQRSKAALFYVLCAVIFASAIVYFQYHTFHWWLLIGPAFAAPIKIFYFRRQKHWDDLRDRRERGEDTA